MDSVDLPDSAASCAPLFGMVIVLVGSHIKRQSKCSLEHAVDAKLIDLRCTDKRNMRCGVGVANMELQCMSLGRGGCPRHILPIVCRWECGSSMSKFSDIFRKSFLLWLLKFPEMISRLNFYKDLCRPNITQLFPVGGMH